MIYTELELPGAHIIDLDPIEDDRGFFARAWSESELRERGLTDRTVQCNMSYNRRRGTLRGMHYQVEPHAEAKFVRCVRGSLYDVIADIRPDSPTYLNWMGMELTASNRQMLYVPEGFAHGFQTLEDDTEAFYQVSAPYVREAERGIRWNDAVLAIEWPHVDERTISKKDAEWPDFQAR